MAATAEPANVGPGPSSAAPPEGAAKVLPFHPRDILERATTLEPDFAPAVPAAVVPAVPTASCRPCVVPPAHAPWRARAAGAAVLLLSAAVFLSLVDRSLRQPGRDRRDRLDMGQPGARAVATPRTRRRRTSDTALGAPHRSQCSAAGDARRTQASLRPALRLRAACRGCAHRRVQDSRAPRALRRDARRRRGICRPSFAASTRPSPRFASRRRPSRPITEEYIL
jgi:hypothetical protein